VRLKRGLSQYRLAKDAGISQAIIHRLEADKRDDAGRLTMQVVKKLAVALHVPTDYLCGLLDDLPGRPTTGECVEMNAPVAVVCAHDERMLTPIVP
jgi:transcriptional regulator with XRE-family HTH domain